MHRCGSEMTCVPWPVWDVHTVYLRQKIFAYARTQHEVERREHLVKEFAKELEEKYKQERLDQREHMQRMALLFPLQFNTELEEAKAQAQTKLTSLSRETGAREYQCGRR